MSAALALSAILVAAHALLGALDLGVGLLLPLAAREQERDAILAGGGRAWSAGAVWTLLVFAFVVAGLPGSLAALRALWPPLVLMLLALLMRGSLSALRPHVLRRNLVDFAFGLASLAAALCQGSALGWFIAGLGTDLPHRHAGPFGTLSVWGLLCAVGSVGLYALMGAGWLTLSCRDAVRVFGREVGRAAAILTAGSVVLCGFWAAWPTGVAARAFAGGWTEGALAALLGAGVLGLLAAFVLSLWGRRPGLPLGCAALAALCGFAAATLLLLAPPSSAGALGGGSPSAYLAFVLLLGSPLVILDVLHWISAGRWKEAAVPREVSHAGRRAGSVANSLHLS